MCMTLCVFVFVRSPITAEKLHTLERLKQVNITAIEKLV